MVHLVSFMTNEYGILPLSHAGRLYCNYVTLDPLPSSLSTLLVVPSAWYTLCLCFDTRTCWLDYGFLEWEVATLVTD